MSHFKKACGAGSAVCAGAAALLAPCHTIPMALVCMGFSGASAVAIGVQSSLIISVLALIYSYNDTQNKNRISWGAGAVYAVFAAMAMTQMRDPVQPAVLELARYTGQPYEYVTGILCSSERRPQ